MEREKTKCAICGHADHILVMHIQKKHGLDAGKYMEKHPGAPLWSTYGLQKIKEQQTNVPTTAMAPRPRKRVPAADIFDQEAFKALSEDEIEMFDTAGEMTPRIDPHFIFPKVQTLQLITVLELQERNKVWLFGPTGTGKTQLVLNLGAKLKAEIWRLNCDVFLKRADLIGTWVLRGKETYFQHGIVPLAMKRGCWLLLDEYDTIDSRTANIFKPILEDRPRLIIPENGGEVVEAHPDFRIIACCNTKGRGDDTGMYVNTLTQSIADRRRFNAFIKMDYMQPEVEEQMLIHRFGSDVTPKEAKALVQVANKIREANVAGRIDLTFSPAELINWTEKWLVTTELRAAAQLCFLNACTPDVEIAVLEIIEQFWGGDESNEPKVS